MSSTMVLDKKSVKIEFSGITLEGMLTVPEGAKGIVLFAHGSGSSRFSPRNQCVAADLNRAGLGTLLFDLLTSQEEEIDRVTREIRFNIPLLGTRLMGAVDWIAKYDQTRHLRIGTFGASTGAAAALIAAARRPGKVRAVVSRGGRPDMAEADLANVTVPTLLIVGGEDREVIELNRQALRNLPEGIEKDLTLVPGATHLFEEPGTLQEVSRLTAQWFLKHLDPEVAPHIE